MTTPAAAKIASPVAVIGSPSTTTKVTLNLLRSAYGRAVYGQMLCFQIELTDPDTGDPRTELALGTVTSVETINPVHSPRAAEAQHVADSGVLAQQSGNAGDTRGVEVSVEAVFRRDEAVQVVTSATTGQGDRLWLPAGASLSNSPATGTSVVLLDQAKVDELMIGVENQRFLGTLRGTRTLVPYTQRDFTGSRGSAHSCVAGTTGSGKTATVAYALACDLFFDGMGQILVDPQGQFATEHGMPFSLQGLAAGLGRKVTVARLSQSVRLRKDAPMFTELLARAGVFTELAFGAGSDAQIANASRVMQDALDDTKAVAAACTVGDWTDADPADLVEYLLRDLRDVLPTGTVYAGRDGQQRVRYAIARPTEDELVTEGLDPALARSFRDGILDQRPSGGKRWRAVLSRFAAIHNLWSAYTPQGAQEVACGVDRATLDPGMLRRKAWPLLMDVFTHRSDRPAPWLILDMSADVTIPGGYGPSEGDDDDETIALDATRRVLDDPGVKARIMRQLVGDLSRAGLAAFKNGEPLNCRITVDEAWQFAGPVEPGTDPAIAALSNMFEDGARDLRKVGVGFRFILQAPSGLREGIWKQCTDRVIGYGITEQSDIKRLANIVGDDHLRLYLSTAGPEATGRYPFMFTGGGSTGLNFGTKPVFLDMFDDPHKWLVANGGWVTAARRRWAHLLPAGDPGGTLTVMPSRPAQGALVEAHRAAVGVRSAGGNRDAAKALVGAGSRRPPAGFGMTPKGTPTGAPVLDIGDPPF